MFHSVEQEKRIDAEQGIMRSGEACEVSLCQYGNLSCVRCCLPHIGGDSHLEDSGENRAALLKKDVRAYRLEYADRYVGPRGLIMKFRNFNPLMDPRIEASQYEDSFADVGRDEMERRFSQRRELFLRIYDREQPRRSLTRYMKEAQELERYRYKPQASAGPVSLFIGGSVSSSHSEQGGMPECQLLGFIGGESRVGCLAHPMSETSRGYDGRDQVGFFHHTGCCESVGCEASREFPFLSASARKVFDKAVGGMSWYEYSRHATSVLVYYLRAYDHLFQQIDRRGILDSLSLERSVAFTNLFYESWQTRSPGRSEIESPVASGGEMSSLDILSTDIPLSERIMHIALGTSFLRDQFAQELQRARERIDKSIREFSPGPAQNADL